MNRRDTLLILSALGAVPFASIAQQPNMVWRIGMLETTAPSATAAPQMRVIR